MTKISDRETLIRVWAARKQYIDASCRNIHSCGEFSSAVMRTTVEMGLSASPQGNTRYVSYRNKVVCFDYSMIEGYDETLSKANHVALWNILTTNLMGAAIDAKKDIVPHNFRRHLFSANLTLQKNLFQTYLNITQHWVKGERNGRMNTMSASNQVGHLIVIG